MTSNTYFSENWNAFWNHPRLLKRSSSAITQKQFQTCLSHIQLNLKKKKKKKAGADHGSFNEHFLSCKEPQQLTQLHTTWTININF